MSEDKWQQCLKTLAERPEFALAEDGYFYWGENDGGFANHWFATSLSQCDIDEIAALLGKRIYVYPQFGIFHEKIGRLKLKISIVDIAHSQMTEFIDTDQTEKLAATKQGLIAIVNKLT